MRDKRLIGPIFIFLTTVGCKWGGGRIEFITNFHPPEVKKLEDSSVVEVELERAWIDFISDPPIFTILDKFRYISRFEVSFKSDIHKLDNISKIKGKMGEGCTVIRMGGRIPRLSDIVREGGKFRLNSVLGNMLFYPMAFHPAYYVLAVKYGIDYGHYNIDVNNLKKYHGKKFIFKEDSLKLLFKSKGFNGYLRDAIERSKENSFKVIFSINPAKEVSFKDTKTTISIGIIPDSMEGAKPTGISEIWFAKFRERSDEARKILCNLREAIGEISDYFEEAEKWEYVIGEKREYAKVDCEEYTDLDRLDSLKIYIYKGKIKKKGGKFSFKGVNYTIVNNESEADVVIFPVIYDNNLKASVNIRFISNSPLVGISIPVALSSRNLIRSFRRNLENAHIYPIARKRYFLYSKDSVAVKKLNFNILQGFTGLWWYCPKEEVKNEGY